MATVPKTPVAERKAPTPIFNRQSHTGHAGQFQPCRDRHVLCHSRRRSGYWVRHVVRMRMIDDGWGGSGLCARAHRHRHQSTDERSRKKLADNRLCDGERSSERIERSNCAADRGKGGKAKVSKL